MEWDGMRIEASGGGGEGEGEERGGESDRGGG